MTVRVLVVDDSRFIQRRLTDILNEEPNMRVIGVAGNGREAIAQNVRLKPDVVTMDVEMPVMDGISAVKSMMRQQPVPILMFSAATTVGARATLDALDAGALDFLPKYLDDISDDREAAKRLLRWRVRGLAGQTPWLRDNSRNQIPVTHKPRQLRSIISGTLRDVRLLAIAASTGGPVALQRVLTSLPDTFPLPIVLVQHMPKNFTRSFAERLNQLCQIRVKEAEDGDYLTPGLALLAPGGTQLEIRRNAKGHSVLVRESRADETYRPSADVTFNSIARNFPGKTLALVLTGMGSDGKLGAVELKKKEGLIWAQNESGCTVYGMPKAIIESGLADSTFDLDEMSSALKGV